MHCPACKVIHDPDALFCGECGRPLAGQAASVLQKQRRAYCIALLFVPVLVIAAGIGYYKYFLPSGTAAVVNDEEITLSELDAAARVRGTALRSWAGNDTGS